MEVLSGVDEKRIRYLVEAGTSVWIDLVRPDEGALAALGRALPIHTLALEDSLELGQRPKVDVYERSTLVVYYGARSAHDGAAIAVEFHLHIAHGLLVTVQAEHSATLDPVREHVAQDPPTPDDSLIHRILDAITDTLAPALDNQHSELERLRTEILERPERSLLGRADELRGHVDRLQRRLAVQRERFGELGEVVLDLPDTRAGAEAYLKDVHDHLADALGDLSGQSAAADRLTDLYFSSSGERIDVVSERLTLLSALLVPLTLVTGFFGMNFGWMTDRIESGVDFLLLGVGGTLAALVFTLVILRLSGRS